MKKRIMAWLPVVLLFSHVWAWSQRPSEQVIREIQELKSSSLDQVEKLNKLFDLTWKYNMLENPEIATYAGFPGQNDRWTDSSPEAVFKRKKDNELIVRTLAGIDLSGKSDEDKLNYALFRRLVDLNLEQTRFPQEYLPLNQMNGPQINLPQMLGLAPLRNKADAEDFLGRLKGIPKVLSQTQAWMEKGLAAGVTPPKITLRGVGEQVLSQIPEKPFDSPLLRPLKALDEKTFGKEIQSQAQEIYQTSIVPAFKSFHGFLTNKYIPNSRDSIGLNELPNGKAWYAFNVRQNTTTTLTPEAIHQIGLSEVKRIRGEMEAIIKETGFEGDFKAFSKFLRTDKQFYFDKPEELLAAYRDISKRADAQLVKLFGVLPRLPYGVIAVPAYQEKTATTAYYNPGSLAMGRSGYFYANTYDLKSRPKWEMEALTLHEAVPGHHLQIALGQELENVPKFRTFSFTTAFVEGWGLYAESLGTEMGFYTDPYSKYGQLTYEMWRAIRLVVDTGMHALGWSRSKAIEFFKNNTGKSEHDITVEIDRYIVWPGQALAYKIGELKIKELRKNAEQELGEAFNIRRFHDKLLGAGAIPLQILENRMKDWVAAEKTLTK